MAPPAQAINRAVGRQVLTLCGSRAVLSTQYQGRSHDVLRTERGGGDWRRSSSPEWPPFGSCPRGWIGIGSWLRRLPIGHSLNTA